GKELVHEVLVAAVDQADAVDRGGALSSKRRDQVAEAAAKIWDRDFGRVERRGSSDDGGVFKVAVSKAAGCPAQAFAIDLDRGAHAAQRLGETESIFIDGLMHD